MPRRTLHKPSEENISRMMITDKTVELNQWNNEDWFGHTCMVSGTGKYRFNQYGTTGFAHWQYRFSTKDAAISWLCWTRGVTVRRVEKDHPQYEVRTYRLGDY